MYYGFTFQDGTSTTTTLTDDGAQTAGHLASFETEAERDEWLARGIDYRGDGAFRRRVEVTGRELHAVSRDGRTSTTLVGWSLPA